MSKQTPGPSQQSFALTPPEVWRDRFIAQAQASPGSKPLDLLGRRYADPGAKVLATYVTAFDFDRFQGFGLYLATV